MSDLTHFNTDGRPTMVDVSGKGSTLREATAAATVYVNARTFGLILSGGMKKGDVLGAAQVAGVMGAKRCPDLIPLCHPVAITGADVSFEPDEESLSVRILATVRCKGETGVEMEALTAVSVAALTIYDMCKAVQRDIRIEGVRLIAKSGGKSGDYRYNELV
ncbi:MAG: cyclic pyranopterin monophosphate synthase MoaC [Clostridiales Family XIII bacterium]|jgi:cyclic pyranopterin phosphate synthase|nr:cyclic pyranopterin monophosphate synthase MoaC [Clostridiales Family XIII bacterium]